MLGGAVGEEDILSLEFGKGNIKKIKIFSYFAKLFFFIFDVKTLKFFSFNLKFFFSTVDLFLDLTFYSQI